MALRAGVMRTRTLLPAPCLPQDAGGACHVLDVYHVAGYIRTSYDCTRARGHVVRARRGTRGRQYTRPQYHPFARVYE